MNSNLTDGVSISPAVGPDVLQMARSAPGKALKTLLVLLDISQKELAHRVQSTAPEISRVIAGKRRNRRLRRLIAAELGITDDDLNSLLDRKG